MLVYLGKHGSLRAAIPEFTCSYIFSMLVLEFLATPLFSKHSSNVFLS